MFLLTVSPPNTAQNQKSHWQTFRDHIDDVEMPYRKTRPIFPVINLVMLQGIIAKRIAQNEAIV
jgi:hypothetical protein